MEETATYEVQFRIGDTAFVMHENKIHCVIVSKIVIDAESFSYFGQLGDIPHFKINTYDKSLDQLLSRLKYDYEESTLELESE